MHKTLAWLSHWPGGVIVVADTWRLNCTCDPISLGFTPYSSGSPVPHSGEGDGEALRWAQSWVEPEKGEPKPSARKRKRKGPAAGGFRPSPPPVSEHGIQL